MARSWWRVRSACGGPASFGAEPTLSAADARCTLRQCGIAASGAKMMLYEVRFQSLFNEGRALSFPCDREGHVDMDALSAEAKGNYLFARAMVGREFATPSVRACEATGA
jgi:hypothetical protein